MKEVFFCANLDLFYISFMEGNDGHKEGFYVSVKKEKSQFDIPNEGLSVHETEKSL